MKLLDGMERMLRGEMPPPPAATLIGMRLESFAQGEAVVALDPTPAHANPMGTVQGGILAAIADAAMGWAFMTTLGEGESYATLEIKVNFLRPVWTGRLEARGRVKSAGRTVSLVECAVGLGRQACGACREHLHDPFVGSKPPGAEPSHRARSYLTMCLAIDSTGV